MGNERSVKIAVVIPNYGLLGGAEGFAAETVRRLARQDAFDIHVLANRWRTVGERVRFHRIPVLSFPRWLKPVSFAVFCRRCLARHRFDVVHSHERIFRMQVLTFHGIPHRGWVLQARRKSMSLFDVATERVEQAGLRCAELKRVMPVSGLAAEKLLARYPHLAARTTVCHPGVAFDRFSQTERDRYRLEIRDRFGFAPSDRIVLFVGMNFEIKRLGLVMRGIGGLAPAIQAHTRLLVVGKGNDRRYRRLARELGIADRVAFAGAVPDATPYFLAGDLFAMPSHFDTFGLAVLEAMAAGLPVVISENVGARDLVATGEHGHVLPADAADAQMAGALESVLSDDHRLRMGRAARDRARRHTWTAVADRLAEVYLSVFHDGQP